VARAPRTNSRLADALGAPAPSDRQVAVTRAVVRWYLDYHYGREGDPGTVGMFADVARLGAFGVPRDAIARNDPAALFKLLIGIVMFQRRQDVQIAAILRSLTSAQVADLTNLRRLLTLIDASPCPNVKSVQALATRCDLAKDPVTKQGTCSAYPAVNCHLKQHTVWMRRYGHFGKVPTSAALVVREAGARDLAEMLSNAAKDASSPAAGAILVEAALCRSWRVSDKISAMFLSLVSNPDLTPGAAGIGEVDWRRYIVIDSNVDLFLREIHYGGPKTYAARRAFVRALSQRVDLRSMKPRFRRDNPRIVQQAMFLFMSAANRRALPHDCMHSRPASCTRCPRQLKELCTVRDAPIRRRLPITGAAAPTQR
jgi:hypothetical protein